LEECTGGCNYVVLQPLKRLMQTTTKSGFIKEKLKVNNGHKLIEFGILPHQKKRGERRNRSTAVIICEKDSSLA